MLWKNSSLCSFQFKVFCLGLCTYLPLLQGICSGSLVFLYLSQTEQNWKWDHLSVWSISKPAKLIIFSLVHFTISTEQGTSLRQEELSALPQIKDFLLGVSIPDLWKCSFCEAQRPMLDYPTMSHHQIQWLNRYQTYTHISNSKPTCVSYSSVPRVLKCP